jgi:cobalt-zinc-cadmium efflux system membrane fusion protein
MTGRLPALLVVLAAGLVAAGFVPGVSQFLRKAVGLVSEPRQVTSTANIGELRKPRGDEKAIVKLTEEQIAITHIEMAAVQPGTLTRRLTVPGAIIPHADQIARVAVKLSGTVAELRKRLGDPVSKDEVLAILESREVADAKSEYLAARLTNELQQDLFERDKVLWEKRIAPEQQYLRSRNLAAHAGMRLNIARQKLFALGLDEKAIADLPNQPEPLLRRQEVRSPMTGRVVERKVDLGMAVGRDNLETELFVIVDLDLVWVDLAVSPADLPVIREGQRLSVTSRGISEKADGQIVFISPLIDRETRAARVVAEIANGDGVWRPGSLVTAAIAVQEQRVPLAVPVGAIQTMESQKVVFVRVPDGFEKRAIVVGLSDDRLAEVVSGLQVSDTVASTNTFLLKAELMKSQTQD